MTAGRPIACTASNVRPFSRVTMGSRKPNSIHMFCVVNKWIKSRIHVTKCVCGRHLTRSSLSNQNNGEPQLTSYHGRSTRGAP